MKNKSYVSKLSFIALLLMLNVSTKIYALDYTISFTGTGASSTVESVIVQNLTKGTTVTVPAGNVLNLTSVITSVDNPSSTVEGISISPNPIQDIAIVSFFTKLDGLTQISAYSIDGRKIVGLSENLLQGNNSFKLSLPKGIYLIKVQGNGFSYTTKAICQSASTAIPKISISSKEQVNSYKSQKSKSAVTLMLYSSGDQLLYKGKSGNYCTVVTDKPVASKTTNFDFIECKDADGNYYSVVKIGTQVWMAENLKTTKYNNRSSIPNVIDDTSWWHLTSDAYCWYKNDVSTYKNTYGALYNWYAVNTGYLAPIGWHVPTSDEWSLLANYLGGVDVAGGKSKETGTTHWSSPNFGATNETGFTAVAGGLRSLDGSLGVGLVGYWYSSTLEPTGIVWGWGMNHDFITLSRTGNGKYLGFSVRCVKD